MRNYFGNSSASHVINANFANAVPSSWTVFNSTSKLAQELLAGIETKKNRSMATAGYGGKLIPSIIYRQISLRFGI